MSVTISGDTGLAGAATGALNGSLGATTPSTVVATTISGTDLTTTGNTILGNASTDTLNVGNGDLIKDASGNVGIGVTPSVWATTVKAMQIGTVGAVSLNSTTLNISNNYYRSTAVSGANTYLTTDFATLYSQALGAHTWSTAPSGTAGTTITFTTAMTLDSSGNLGLGVTPSAWSSSFKAMQISGASIWANATGTYISQNNYFASGGYTYITSNYASDYYQSAGAHVWRTAASGTAGATFSPTTAMTLDAAGILWTGGGSPTVPTGLTGFSNGIFVAGSAANTSLFYTSAGVGAGAPIQVTRLNDGGGIYFFRNGSTAGNISIATGSISVNNASDYRLKDNVESLSGSLKKIMQVRPVTFTWKENGSVGKSVIAHELQEVFPEVVFGEKDATNEDGSIKTQSVALGNLMPDLISAIQEQQAMIDELKAKVAALEAA